MHPLIRMQRDAMLHARKIQAGNNDADLKNSSFTPECAFAPSTSTSPSWSPEPSTPHLGASRASSSASPYSPPAPLGTLPPDALQLNHHTYNTHPTHVPSNASYDVYARQRHDSPQPLLEPVYEDVRSGPMPVTDRSYFGSMSSADCIVPSNAVTEWPPYMYNQQSMPQQQWQGTTKPMSRMSSTSTAGFSHDSSASSYGFEPSTPLSLHDLIVPPPTFESNDDPFIQLISNSSYPPPDFVGHAATHYQEDTTQLTNNYSFQNYMNYHRPPSSSMTL